MNGVNVVTFEFSTLVAPYDLVDRTDVSEEPTLSSISVIHLSTTSHQIVLFLMTKVTDFCVSDVI
jgi:hypothetical protein